MNPAFAVVLALVVLQRLAELRLSRRHEAALRARGAVEHGAAHYPVMVALHVAFLVACPLEVLLLGRTFHLALAVPMAMVLLLAQTVRLWTMVTLGERWTTRVLVLPGVPRVTAGPYRHTRHPNYLAVMAEIVALPLFHTAWVTASVFTVLDAVLLRERMRVEDAALR